MEVLGAPHPVAAEDVDAVEEARSALAVAGPVRVQGNRVGAPEAQLRLGSAGRVPVQARPGEMELAGAPDADPERLVEAHR